MATRSVHQDSSDPEMVETQNLVILTSGKREMNHWLECHQEVSKRETVVMREKGDTDNYCSHCDNLCSTLSLVLPTLVSVVQACLCLLHMQSYSNRDNSHFQMPGENGRSTKMALFT